MKSKSYLLLGIIVAMVMCVPLVNAAQDVHIGNAICPISGEKIGTMGPGIEVNYNGKIYSLCCPMCVNEFNKDPEKYAAIAEKESMHSEHEHMDHKESLKPVKNEQTGEISYYTCGMHPSVKVSVENFNNGDTKCPICFMPLTPVIKDDVSSADWGEDVVSKVEVKMNELKLAGVRTEHVVKQHLFKDIRAVGRVAYDPQLAIAQDEYIAAVKSLAKAKSGQLAEIVERADSLVESSARKLRLLGLNDKQIEELAQTQKVQSNLILPGEKMWVYGDVYEYELNWIKEGSHIIARPVGLAAEEYYGEIISINPVVDPQTRSVRFRAMIDNANQRLKPEMYVDIEIMSQYEDPNGETEVLSIPKTALLDTGRRKIVWVDLGNGKFEGRKVQVGPEAINHSDNPERYYPVIKGLKEGEKVVTKGNFLIDSQSQITGVASSAYGGALGDSESSSGQMTGHVH